MSLVDDAQDDSDTEDERWRLDVEAVESSPLGGGEDVSSVLGVDISAEEVSLTG